MHVLIWEEELILTDTSDINVLSSLLPEESPDRSLFVVQDIYFFVEVQLFALMPLRTFLVLSAEWFFVVTGQ